IINSGLTNDIYKPDAALKFREAIIDARSKKISINTYAAFREYHTLALNAISLFCQKKDVKKLKFPVKGTIFKKYLLEYIDIQKG
ncbi:MAG: hypothetical protein PUP93_27975, partial [Rhizonema sp. NSF051]|nr:hypothetical protein [Rhizonema sp. NSF051]